MRTNSETVQAIMPTPAATSSRADERKRPPREVGVLQQQRRDEDAHGAGQDHDREEVAERAH